MSRFIKRAGIFLRAWRWLTVSLTSLCRAAWPWTAAVLLALCAPAQAQKSMALVIGNGNYLHESKLANPVNDAQLIARTLRGLGFTVEEKNNLAKRDMELAIARFVRESAGADAAVLYYAGHGSQPLNGGRNFLLPVDAKVEGDDTLNTDGIAADFIVEQLERSANPAKLRLVVLDACRNNRLAGKARSGVRGLGRPAPSDDYTLIAFSTNDQSVALDGSGAHSPYAQALAGHLARARELPVRRIFELTASDVRAATSQKQRPRTYGDLDSRTLLSGVLLASVVPEPVRTAPVAQPSPQPAQAPAPQPAPPTAQALRPGSVIKDCADCPELVVIPAGRFMMGSNEDTDEKPIHPVNIKQFAIGKTEVTQAQWQAAMGSNPSRYANCGPACPVEQVSWDDVQQFIKKLNAKTGRIYRLPSEAEWEYAARAGSQSQYSFGDSESQLGQHAWYRENSGNSTKPVAGKKANVFGLHDMHGNVSEWVEACWHDNYSGAPTDGSAWTTSCTDNHRVLRGGSWNGIPTFLRSANRVRYSPDIRDSVTGFRLARTLVTP